MVRFDFGMHSLSAAKVNNPRDHDADTEKVQEWPSNANNAITQIYDRGRSNLGESPILKINY